MECRFAALSCTLILMSLTQGVAFPSVDLGAPFSEPQLTVNTTIFPSSAASHIYVQVHAYFHVEQFPNAAIYIKNHLVYGYRQGRENKTGPDPDTGVRVVSTGASSPGEHHTVISVSRCVADHANITITLIVQHPDRRHLPLRTEANIQVQDVTGDVHVLRNSTLHALTQAVYMYFTQSHTSSTLVIHTNGFYPEPDVLLEDASGRSVHIQEYRHAYDRITCLCNRTIWFDLGSTHAKQQQVYNLAVEDQAFMINATFQSIQLFNVAAHLQKPRPINATTAQLTLTLFNTRPPAERVWCTQSNDEENLAMSRERRSMSKDGLTWRQQWNVTVCLDTTVDYHVTCYGVDVINSQRTHLIAYSFQELRNMDLIKGPTIKEIATYNGRLECGESNIMKSEIFSYKWKSANQVLADENDPILQIDDLNTDLKEGPFCCQIFHPLAITSWSKEYHVESVNDASSNLSTGFAATIIISIIVLVLVFMAACLPKPYLSDKCKNGRRETDIHESENLLNGHESINLHDKHGRTTPTFTLMTKAKYTYGHNTSKTSLEGDCESKQKARIFTILPINQVGYWSEKHKEWIALNFLPNWVGDRTAYYVYQNVMIAVGSGSRNAGKCVCKVDLNTHPLSVVDLPLLPDILCSVGIIYADGYLYVIGGQEYEGTTWKMSSKIYRLAMDSSSDWESLNTLTKPVAWPLLAFQGGHIHVLGGHDGKEDCDTAQCITLTRQGITVQPELCSKMPFACSAVNSGVVNYGDSGLLVATCGKMYINKTAQKDDWERGCDLDGTHANVVPYQSNKLVLVYKNKGFTAYSYTDNGIDTYDLSGKLVPLLESTYRLYSVEEES